MERTDQPAGQHSPRAQAVHTAAQAVNAHQQTPDTATFRDMQTAVQQAQNLGATLTDIRDARATA